jgi:hypothetical protein
MENRLLKRTVRLKTERKVTGDWIKLHNVELLNMYSSQHVFRMIKTRMRWVVYVENIEEVRNAYNILVGKVRAGDHFGDTRG